MDSRNSCAWRIRSIALIQARIVSANSNSLIFPSAWRIDSLGCYRDLMKPKYGGLRIRHAQVIISWINALFRVNMIK